MKPSVCHGSTKRMLADSLKKLMQTKSLNKISIHEIAKDCGLNRQTFYYHFHDIYDLLEWFYIEEAAELLEDKYDSLTLSDGFLRILNYIQQNETLCLCTLDSVGHSHLRQFFYGTINRIYLHIVNEYSEDLDVSEQHKSFIAHYYTVSFSAFVEFWLRSGLKEDPNEMIKLCEAATQGTIRKALERFSKSPPEK